jgi:hypothetical protein
LKWLREVWGTAFEGLDPSLPTTRLLTIGLARLILLLALYYLIALGVGITALLTVLLQQLFS